MNKERIKEYMDKSDTLECITFIQNTVKEMKKYYKQVNNAREKELNDGYMISRAKSTTNYSNTFNADRMYMDTKETLEFTIIYFNKTKI